MFIDDYIMIDTTQLGGWLIIGHQHVAANTAGRGIEFELKQEVFAFLETPAQLALVGCVGNGDGDITKCTDFRRASKFPDRGG
jgi:hypothetical protein